MNEEYKIINHSQALIKVLERLDELTITINKIVENLEVNNTLWNNNQADLYNILECIKSLNERVNKIETKEGD